jgi:hypothetical protein
LRAMTVLMMVGFSFLLSGDGCFFAGDAPVLAGAGGRGERELRISGSGGEAGSGVGPGLEDQDDGFV